MQICPVCNGLTKLHKVCSICGERMAVLDRVENYEDNYSPYLDYALTDLNDGSPPDLCQHVLVCSACGNKEVCSVRMELH